MIFSRFVVSGSRLVVCNDHTYGEMSLPVGWYDGGEKEKAEYLHSVLQRLARMYYLFIMQLYIVLYFILPCTCIYTVST